MWKTILLIYIVVYSSADQISRKKTWKYCSNRTIGKYLVERPKPCKPGDVQRKIEGIAIVKPKTRIINIEAWLCRRKVVTYSCTYYFFGTQVCEPVSTSYVPLSRDSCFILVDTHYSSDGPLYTDDETSLSSRNELSPQFKWPRTVEVEVSNSYLARTKLSFDNVKRKFSHVTIDDLICEEDRRTCTSPEWRVVFSKQKSNDACQEILTNRTLNIFELEKEKLFEVPGENLVFKTVTSCNQEEIACYGKGQNLLCTPSGYTIILPEGAKVEGERMEGSLELLPANLRVLEQAVTTLAGEVKLALQSLQAEVSLQHCMNARAVLIALASAQKETPSEVLSLLLGREAYAIFHEGLLHELECVSTTSVLQPTLAYKGHIAKSPVFHTYVGSETIVTQIRQRLFLSNTIQTTNADITGRKAFVVKDEVLIFENNTLQEEKAAVSILSIGGFQLQKSSINFAEEELVNDLIDVSQTDEEYTRQVVNNLVLITETNLQGRGINPNFLHNIHQENRGNFLKRLRESQMPTTWEVVKSVLMWASNTWSVILSILGLYLLVSCLRKRKGNNKQGTTREVEVSTL